MTTSEFSSQFDVLYNNIMSNQAPGLDEYEKSVFLTKAQDEIIKNYFNPKGNKYQEGFDGSEKRQIDFSMIIKTEELNAAGSITNKLDTRSKVYKFPTSSLMILNESFMQMSSNETTATVSKYFVVVPLAYNEYTRLMGKPYKLPIKGHVWRLLQSIGTTDPSTTKTTSGSGDSATTTYTTTIIEGTTRDTYAELVGDLTSSGTYKYMVRYLRKPNPIILVNLSDNYSNVSIQGKTSVTECELDPIIHEEILQRAVELAKAAYVGDLNSVTTMGQRSE